MNKKTRSILEIIALVLILATIFVLLKNNNLLKIRENNDTQNEFQEENQVQGVEISVQSVFQSDDSFNINAEYPQFSGANNEFNQKIDSTVNEKIEQFKTDALQNKEARLETASSQEEISAILSSKLDFIAEWEPVQINENYISFVERLYYYTGGAHGINETYAFNYDLKNNKEITIMDFLGNSQNAMDELSELARGDVNSQLEAAGLGIDYFASGLEPTEENFRNFTFNYNSLTVYFQQYQVAPGSFGEVKVTLYKDTLESNSVFSDYLN
jgi:hypothetical protein